MEKAPRLPEPYAAEEKARKRLSFGYIHLQLAKTAQGLSVHIREARALRACDANGFSDPYVKWYGATQGISSMLILCF